MVNNEKNAAGVFEIDYNQSRMKIILWLLLLVGINCIIYSKISSQQGNLLTNSDYLLSAMGYFRMTLNNKTCQLQIQNFTGTNYGIVGYYPRTILSSCKSYSIINNSFISNNNDVILSLQATQIQSVYDQVFVTIDQMSIIRINGVFNKRYESSQNWISIFRSPHQYIYSISSLSVTRYSSLSFVRNNGNWGFSAINGQLRLFRIDDVSKIYRYNYTSFTITPNNLFDYNSNSLPKADYNQFRYYSTCFTQNELQNFQGPFTFIINQYWPQIRLIDRKGYQIIALRYPKPHCLNKIGLDNLHNLDSCMNWFCPSNTFQLKGDCLAICPLPYFHQIGRHGINRCVINCQAGFDKDSIKRICSCGQIQNYRCPASLKTTPLGCLCPEKTYFNPYNQIQSNISSYCYPSCGPFLYPHKDGLCVPCPQYCQICTLSSNSYNYLKCSICRQGYHPNSQGYCVRNCINPVNLTNNSTCLKCNITFCFNCSTSITICNACSKPYSLFNNLCIVQCPRGFKSLFDKRNGFKCVLIPGCNVQSALISSINNQSNCLCMRNGNSAYTRNCGNDLAKNCAFDHYFDFNTMECLFCPIGCLTCYQDKNTRIQCTSCRPDYSLFVTLSRNHYCQRNSILSICINNYDFNTQMCIINNLAQAVVITKSRGLCFGKTINCSICVNDSDTQCSLCASNFYLYQGKCYQSCPKGASPYKYQKVCINIVNQHCQKEITQNAYWIFSKDTINQFSDGYIYLISLNFQMVNISNDPLGYIFSQIRTSNSRKKQVNIATSRQKCSVCQKGYGITAKGSCEKCTYPCIQCVYISNVSSYCLKCDSDYKLNNSNICQKLDVTQLPCRFGQYRNESRICQQDCLTYFRTDRQIIQNNKSYSINCSTNCPNGYTVSTFLKDNEVRLKCSKISISQSNSPSIVFLGNKIVMQKYVIYMIVSSTRLEYSSNISINIQAKRATNQRLLTSNQNSNINYYPTAFGIIVIDSSPVLSDSVIVRLPSAQISSNFKGETIYLSNSIYGMGNYNKSFIDIIYNDTSNLYFYGRACIVIAFLLTILFLAEKINYKTDNLFITFSVIYLVLPSLNLQPDSSSFNSYSFIYGFSWSSHLQLFSSPRLITTQTNWFDGYLQKSNNNAHYLLNVDSNIIRNGWSIILMLIISVAILGIMLIIMKFFSVKKIKEIGIQKKCSFFANCLSSWRRIGYNSQDFDHSEQIKYLLIFLIENSFIGLCYYSVLTILNNPWQLAPTQKQNMFKIISAICLASICIYSLLRYYTNKIGGLYCFKRIFLGIALGLISNYGGIDQNKALSILVCVKIQILFGVMRYREQFVTNYFYHLIKNKPKIIDITARKIKNRQTLNQRPKFQQQFENNIEKKQLDQKQQSLPQKFQFWTMLIQQILIIIVYIFALLINELKQASVLIIWIIISAFMVNFLVQIVEMIIRYWSNTYQRIKQHEKPFYKKIRTNWDHQLSLKSLASTKY